MKRAPIQWKQFCFAITISQKTISVYYHSYINLSIADVSGSSWAGTAKQHRSKHNEYLRATYPTQQLATQLEVTR